MRNKKMNTVIVGLVSSFVVVPAFAEQPTYDRNLEKRALIQVQAKIDHKQMRGAIGPRDKPNFVTENDVKSLESVPIEYQPPKPDSPIKNATALPPVVYVNPLKVDTIITTATSSNRRVGSPKRQKIIWEKFDSKGNRIYD